MAAMFGSNNAVIFDLFNEPFPDAANNFSNPTAAWTCLRDGGICTGIGYPVAGMQSLVNTIRGVGATNVIMVPGLRWTNDLSQWLAFRPTDPRNNLMASWHTYNFNACVTVACWDAEIGTVAAQMPVTAGEIGQNTCAHDYIDQVMAWADAIETVAERRYASFSSLRPSCSVLWQYLRSVGSAVGRGGGFP
jgi:endoglucanase